MKRNIKNVIYELRILKTKIHKTFNVNSLTKTDLIILIIKKLKVKNKNKKYEVNKIFITNLTRIKQSLKTN